MTHEAATFSAEALAYFAKRAIDPKIAAAVNVAERPGEIVFPYRAPDGAMFQRARSLNGGTKVRQPQGVPLAAWLPVSREGTPIITEGESDALAALSALARSPEAAGLRELPVVAAPGTGCPAERVVAAVKSCGSGGAFLALDADEAGRKYADKLAAALREAGIRPTPLELPDGLDLAAWLAGLPEDERGERFASALIDAESSAAEPVRPAARPLAELLAEVEGFLGRFVVLPGRAECAAVALWIAHSWALDGAHATPYLLLISPEKRSGKTRALEVLELLVARPWRVAGGSEAAMFRKIAKSRPTLLLDEIDAIFGSPSERTEGLRAILNAGNRPGVGIPRCVGQDRSTVEDFEVYCPKALAGIDNDHRLPETIRDRGLIVRMRRRTVAEPVERFRYRTAKQTAEPLTAQLEAWAESVVEQLTEAEPEEPAGLGDRAGEAWEPLLAIADLAGGEWPGRAREAALALSGSEEPEAASLGALLLDAMRGVFGSEDRMASAALLEAVNADEELPFGGWRDGRGLDARGLARLLKPYGIRPGTVRVGEDTAKGYKREDMADVWARYTPQGASHGSHPSHEPPGDGQSVPEGAGVTHVTHVTALTGSDGAATPQGASGPGRQVQADASRNGGCASHSEPVAGCRYCEAP